MLSVKSSCVWSCKGRNPKFYTDMLLQEYLELVDEKVCRAFDDIRAECMPGFNKEVAARSLKVVNQYYALYTHTLSFIPIKAAYDDIDELVVTVLFQYAFLGRTETGQLVFSEDLITVRCDLEPIRGDAMPDFDLRVSLSDGLRDRDGERPELCGVLDDLIAYVEKLPDKIVHEVNNYF